MHRRLELLYILIAAFKRYLADAKRSLIASPLRENQAVPDNAEHRYVIVSHVYIFINNYIKQSYKNLAHMYAFT